MSVSSDEAGHSSAVPDIIFVRISGAGEVLTWQNLSGEIRLTGIYTCVDYSNCDVRSLGGFPNLFCAIHPQWPLSVSDLIR
jgi:hypothetical protein